MMQLATDHKRALINGIRMHWLESGGGPPVFLLHGFPETSYAWRHQIPELAKHFRVIAPDLRGYGDTEKPTTGYDKRTMAADIAALAQHLGLNTVSLVGHDRGARVATRFAKDYPDRIERLAVLDNVPTRIVFEQMSARVAKGYWFFNFQQVPDLPEALITGREDVFLRHLFADWTYRPDALSEEDITTYVRAFAQPGSLRGAFSDYRAAATDLEQDQADADVPIRCPILAMWGQDFHLVGQMFDMPVVWRSMGTDVDCLAIAECCHLPQEERPDIVNAALLKFLKH